MALTRTLTAPAALGEPGKMAAHTGDPLETRMVRSLWFECASQLLLSNRSRRSGLGRKRWSAILVNTASTPASQHWQTPYVDAVTGAYLAERRTKSSSITIGSPQNRERLR